MPVLSGARFAVSPIADEADVALGNAPVMYQMPAQSRWERLFTCDPRVHWIGLQLCILDDRLKAVTDKLHMDPADNSTLASLGRVAGAGERTLSRLFQTELGMSFSQWRTILRIQHSLVHLLNGHTITRTSALCGWSNPTSFIEAFTRILGQTPGQYQHSQ